MSFVDKIVVLAPCIPYSTYLAKGAQICIYSVSQKQDAQLSQRDRAAGYISFGRKWKTGTQRQYFTDIVSLASTTVT